MSDLPESDVYEVASYMAGWVGCACSYKHVDVVLSAIMAETKSTSFDFHHRHGGSCAQFASGGSGVSYKGGLTSATGPQHCLSGGLRKPCC